MIDQYLINLGRCHIQSHIVSRFNFLRLFFLFLIQVDTIIKFHFSTVLPYALRNMREKNEKQDSVAPQEALSPITPGLFDQHKSKICGANWKT
jgi:hypothetical protein